MVVEGVLVGVEGEGGGDGLVGDLKKGVQLWSHIMSSVLPRVWHLEKWMVSKVC